MTELEIFDCGMAEFGTYLTNKGELTPPFYGNILLGSLGTLNATARNLLNVVECLPKGMVWSATGVGRSQYEINVLALAMGGHVRVGLEDNLWYDNDRKKPATNVGFVERIVKVAEAMGRPIATPLEARKIIGIKY